VSISQKLNLHNAPYRKLWQGKLNFILTFLILKLSLFSTFAQEVFLPETDLNLSFVEINDTGFEFKIKIQAKTVKEVLERLRLEIQPQDLIFPSLEEDIFSEIKITIIRANPIFLDLYEKKEKIFTQKKSVGEFLEEQKIELEEDDLINQKLQEEIFPGIEIKIWKKPKPPRSLVKTPKQQEANGVQIGLASWYSFIPGNFTASRFFPRGTKLAVTNLSNGRQVVVKVNDWGPQAWTGRILDLEKTAFAQIAPLEKGVVKVRIERLK